MSQCPYSKVKDTYCSSSIEGYVNQTAHEYYGGYVSKDVPQYETLGQLNVKEGFVNQTARGDNTQRAVHVSENRYATLESMSSCPM